LRPEGDAEHDAGVERPETRYAWNGDVALAYQVMGDGPVDLLYLQGWTSNVELNWESPHLARFLSGLAGIGRLITVDRRGWGLSERFSPADVPPVETLTEDLEVVMSAVGSDETVMVASCECTAIAALFAASHPERVSGLVLIDPWVSYLATDETPWMWSSDLVEELSAQIRSDYPLPQWVQGVGEREGAWLGRLVRFAAAPGALIAEFRRFQATDVREVLPLIQVPTLILADSDGTDDNDPRNASFVAERIAGSRFVLLAGGIHPAAGWQHWYERNEGTVREIRAFVGDLRHEQASFGRVLATVLFTDIVGSTAAAVNVGDSRWRNLLERHRVIVRSLLVRYRGTEVDTAGDGFFATFDGPARAIRCAQAIVDGVKRIGLQVRAGVHTGECETINGQVGGIAVHIGARVGSLASPSEVLVSQTVRDLVAGSGLTFEDAGEHELKGVPDRWRLYRVVDGMASS
jgi:class 3 adenylate cyclase